MASKNVKHYSSFNARLTNARLTNARVVRATKRELILVMPAPVAMTIPRPNRDRGKGCRGRKHFSCNARGDSLARRGPELLLEIVHHLRTATLEMHGRTCLEMTSFRLKLCLRQNDSNTLTEDRHSYNCTVEHA